MLILCNIVILVLYFSGIIFTLVTHEKKDIISYQDQKLVVQLGLFGGLFVIAGLFLPGLEVSLIFLTFMVFLSIVWGITLGKYWLDQDHV